MSPEAVAELEAIAAANGGRLTPEAVVERARNRSSALHPLFDWDVKRAAQKHWLDCARELIRSVRINVTTETTVVRSVAYVRDPRVPADEQGYRSVVSIRSDRDLAREVLLDEFGRAAAALKRAHEVAAALNLDSEVREIRERVVGLQASLQTAAQ